MRRGTAPASSALPRLTLRRVHSVSRWNHETGPDGSPGGGPGSGGQDRDGTGGTQDWLRADDDDLGPAAQLILKAGVCARVMKPVLRCCVQQLHACDQQPGQLTMLVRTQL